MKAGVWIGEKELCLEERQIPAPAEGELILKVKSVAICGTDIRMWRGTPQKKLVLGHEIAGTVSAIGEKTKGYTVGEKVAVAPNIGCGICDQCVSGRTHLCPDYKALGINMDGGFAEYVRIPKEAVQQGNVCKLDDRISFSEAAAVEPLSCVYNAFEQYHVYPGDQVLVIGAGPIGCMHIMLAKMAGASKIILSDLSPARLSCCKEIFPDVETYCGDDLLHYIQQTTNGHGVDVCVTACPSAQAQAQAPELMAMFGRICFFGGLPASQEPVPLNTNLIHYRHLLVTGTSRSSVSQYRKCLQLVSSGVLPLAQLVTNHFTLDQINEAFQFVAAANGIKSVIDFD